MLGAARMPNSARVARHVWLGLVLSESGPQQRKRSPSTALLRFVACGLFNHMHRDGGGVYATERTLATETGLDRRTVRAAEKELQTQGWLLRYPKGLGRFGSQRFVREAALPESVNNSVSIGTSNAPLAKGHQQSGNGSLGVLHRDTGCAREGHAMSLNQVTIKKPVMGAKTNEPSKEARKAVSEKWGAIAQARFLEQWYSRVDGRQVENVDAEYLALSDQLGPVDPRLRHRKITNESETSP